MKTLLIVEDETKIRQGIRAIVERGDVPVSEILECRNGKEALETLARRSVDVMISDIRMPVMDGLELVRRSRELGTCAPRTLIISGYDEFDYAVGMFREGISDYLLKPIDRDKLLAVLAKLDGDLAAEQRERESRAEAGRHVLRSLMLGGEGERAESAAPWEQFSDLFPAGTYTVVCLPPSFASEPPPGVLSVPNVDGHTVLIGGNSLDLPALPPFAAACAGVSQPRTDVRYLRDAFLEAASARGDAFMRGKTLHFSVRVSRAEPDGTPVEAMLTQLGAGNGAAAKQALSEFVLKAQNGEVDPAVFAAAMRTFARAVADRYADELDVDGWRGLENVWIFPAVYDCYRAICAKIDALCEKLRDDHDNRTRQKIMRAAAYAREHFLEDLDMAAVSRYVSMNYTQFSYLFGQYIGVNFLEYIRNLRVEEGKRLLLASSAGLREISRKCGFKNDKHFMRVFKQVTGVSPGEYRRAGGGRAPSFDPE